MLIYFSDDRIVVFCYSLSYKFILILIGPEINLLPTEDSCTHLCILFETTCRMRFFNFFLGHIHLLAFALLLDHELCQTATYGNHEFVLEVLQFV